MDGTGQLFARLVRELDGKLSADVIAYPATEPLGYAALIAKVEATLGEGPVLLLGESFSGPIAIELARRHPDRVRGLILAATFARSPVFQFVARIGSRLDFRLFPAPLMRAFLMGGHRDDELAGEIERLVALLPQDVVAMRMRDVAKVDVRTAFAAVTCPILVLHGENDYLVATSDARRELATHPLAIAKFMPGPHMLLQIRTAAAAAEICAFAALIAQDTTG